MNQKCCDVMLTLALVQFPRTALAKFRTRPTSKHEVFHPFNRTLDAVLLKTAKCNLLLKDYAASRSDAQKSL